MRGSGSREIDGLTRLARAIAGLNHGDRFQAVLASDRRGAAVTDRVDEVLGHVEERFEADALHRPVDVVHLALLVQRLPRLTPAELEEAITMGIELTGCAHHAGSKIGVG